MYRFPAPRTRPDAAVDRIVAQPWAAGGRRATPSPALATVILAVIIAAQLAATCGEARRVQDEARRRPDVGPPPLPSTCRVERPLFGVAKSGDP
jgi:hypothetical protein